jgi:rare lipoprotein A
MERHRRRDVQTFAAVMLAGVSLAACATVQPRYAAHAPSASQARPPGAHRGYKTGDPYQVGGIWYVPHDQPHYDEKGIASWYGDAFNMKPTADGEIFDMNGFSAAHTTLPLPSMVEVTNLDNGRKLVVRVNDRGPFVGDRIIDLSHAAAHELGYDRQGLAHVRVRYVGPAALASSDGGSRYAQAKPAAPIRPAPPTSSVTPVAQPSPEASTVPPPEPVKTATLPPPVPAVYASPAPAGAPGAFRIQAGAFGDQGNAQRAVAQLSAAGDAVIEPVERDGTTIYRVVLPGPADEAGALALRDRVAQFGFADARVVRPF